MSLFKIFAVACIFAPTLLMAGPKLTFNDGKQTLEIAQLYQLWDVESFSPGGVPAPDARNDLYLRTGRLGVRGQAYPKLDYWVWFAYDNAGKDPVTGTLASPQVVPNSAFQVWDAYFMWHADSTWANLTFGLFRPVTGREFTSSEASVPSLEKALTHYYLRDHLLTRASGRETGVNLGGYWAQNQMAFGYNFGAFDAVQEKTATAAIATPSTQWSPLLTGRISATLGDPENKEYRMNSDFNFFGKRTGITVAGYATWQGAMDLKTDTTATVAYLGGFDKNTALGGDVLANWKYLEVDGEIAALSRSFSTSDTTALYKAEKASKDSAYVHALSYQDIVWHVRASCSIPVGTQFVEPTVMYTQFIGDKSSPINTNGRDQLLDVGVNWYVQKNNMKLSLHYGRQDGQARSMYTQGPSKTGALKVRSDYVALGLMLNY